VLKLVKRVSLWVTHKRGLTEILMAVVDDSFGVLSCLYSSEESSSPVSGRFKTSSNVWDFHFLWDSQSRGYPFVRTRFHRGTRGFPGATTVGLSLRRFATSSLFRPAFFFGTPVMIFITGAPFLGGNTHIGGPSINPPWRLWELPLGVHITGPLWKGF